MDAVPVRWRTPAGGFDGPLDDRAGILVVGVAGQADRAAARLALRAAVRAALARCCGVGPDAVHLHATPGQAPHATIDHPATRDRAWLAFSHDGTLSLAALRFGGPAGIDLARIVPVPDWAPVARDYLGPAVAASLAATPAAQRDAAFARAWSEREARLKCLGWQLREWRADGEAALQACTVRPLDVAAGYVAHLAFR